MIIGRKLQVTARKGAASHTMKTLEGHLAYADEKGEANMRRCISSRCAEVDEEAPIQLGVSRAILDNVIFCHQEDSNWPLSEPAALKKKFDDIFEATKYTKALDQIKALRKEQAAEVKVDRERLVALKTDRERAKKLANSMDKLTIDLSAKQTEHDDLDQEIRTLYTTNKEQYDQTTRYNEIVNQGNTIETNIDTIQGAQNSIRQSMKPLDEPSDELQSRLSNYNQHVTEQAEQVNSRQRDLRTEEERTRQARTRLSSQQTQLGSAKAVKNQYEENLRNRQNLVLTLAGKHSITGFADLPIENDQIDEFAKILQDEYRKTELRLADFKTKRSRDEEEKASEIAKLKNEESTVLLRCNNIKDEIARTTQEVNKLSAKIEDSRVSEADVQAKEQSLKDHKSRIDTTRKAITEAKYDDRLRRLGVEQREADSERDALLKEMAALSKQSETRSRLTVKRQEKEEKDAALKQTIESNDAKFRKCVGQAPAAVSMETDLNTVLRDKESELSSAERLLNSASKQTQTHEAKATFAKGRIADLQKQIEDIKSKVAEATDERPLQQAVNEAEEESDIRRKDLELMELSAKFYQRILDTAKKDHSCMACKRSLKAAEMPALEKHCNDTIKSAPQRKVDIRNELKEWEEEVAKLRALQPLELTAKTIHDHDMPAVKADLEKSKGEFETSTAAQTQARTKVDTLKVDIKELQSLRRVAQDATRLSREIKLAQDVIERIESELAITGSVETADDVQIKLDVVNAKLAKAAGEIKELTSERDKQKQSLQLTENTVARVELDLSNARHSLSERQGWETRRAEHKTTIESRQTQLKNLQDSASKTGQPLRQLEDERQRMRTEFDGQERELSALINSMNRSMDSLASASKSIEDYLTSDASHKLEDIETAIKDLLQKVERHESQARKIQEQISRLEKEAAESEQVKRNISDNLEFRRLEKELRDKQAKLEKLDVRTAATNSRRFKEQYERNRRKQNDMQAAQSTLKGQIVAMTSNLTEKQEELDTEYKDIKIEYRKQLVKVKVTELATQDLEKYGKALDTAIMKFHEHKMEEINDTIQNLWTKTYQGTDIDKILIKSDAEGATKSGRSYNYRVVMLKDTVEMDMRGRCSAGQKVLASIIIRLALAESFGTNCGILALDEPTTNLDKDNISSLACALADIIRERRGQSNFQLIVITHDEDLLQELSKADVLEKYWRVSRNPRQKSIIERQRVDDLQ